MCVTSAWPRPTAWVRGVNFGTGDGGPEPFGLAAALTMAEIAPLSPSATIDTRRRRAGAGDVIDEDSRMGGGERERGEGKKARSVVEGCVPLRRSTRECDGGHKRLVHRRGPTPGTSRDVRPIRYDLPRRTSAAVPQGFGAVSALRLVVLTLPPNSRPPSHPNSDANRDGTVDLKELGAVLRSMGLDFSGEELGTILAELDSDGSGTIDFSEFVKMMGQCVLAMHATIAAAAPDPSPTPWNPPQICSRQRHRRGDSRGLSAF